MPLQVETEQGRWVQRLGYAGLIPFVGCALLLFVVHDEVLPLLAGVFIRHAFAPWLPSEQIDSYVAGLVILGACLSG